MLALPVDLRFLFGTGCWDFGGIVDFVVDLGVATGYSTRLFVMVEVMV